MESSTGSLPLVAEFFSGCANRALVLRGCWMNCAVSICRAVAPLKALQCSPATAACTEQPKRVAPSLKVSIWVLVWFIGGHSRHLRVLAHQHRKKLWLPTNHPTPRE